MDSDILINRFVALCFENPMASTFFDTYDSVKRLQAAGVSSHQAEAHAKALSDAMNKERVKKRLE